MISLNPGISHSNSFQTLSLASAIIEKKVIQPDNRCSQYQALWQRSVISGALRDGVAIHAAVQKRNTRTDLSLVTKVENILFFDTDTKERKKREGESKDKEKKKLKSLAQLVLLTRNNPSCKKATFKISRESHQKKLLDLLHNNLESSKK